MKNSPPTFRRICAASLLLMSASWVSYGQQVQTLKDINSLPQTESSEPDEMIQAGGSLFISTDNALSGSELWKYTVLANFQGARGVAVDATGTLYVADTQNHVIRKIGTDGVVTTLAGVVGQSGLIDGTGLAARFNSPEGIAVVTTGVNAGTVFVADTGNHLIRRISPAGAVSRVAGGVQNIGGVNTGVPGYVDNANPDDARFRDPRGVAVRPVGNNIEVYISDSGNHTVRKIEILSLSSAVTTLAGNGTLGDQEGTGTGARFNNPGGLGIDNVIDGITGRPSLYLADTGNNKVRKVGLGGAATTVAGSGTVGSANGTGAAASFNAPRGVVCDAATSAASSVVFIADTGNHVIRRIQANTRAVTTLAGTAGTAGGTNGPGNTASFSAPRGLAFRGTEIIVADVGNHALRSVVASGTGVGTVSLRAGQIGTPGSMDGAASGTATPTPIQVKDILPGAGSSSPEGLTAVAANVFFAATNADGERDLWKSDGTNAGTVRVGNTLFPNDPSGPKFLTAVNNTLFFQGYSSTDGAELWKSDGTTAGTVQVKDINPGFDGSLMENLYNANGTLLLGATNALNGVELWRSGGTEGSTVEVKDLFTESVGSNPSNFTPFNGSYYFVATSDYVDLENGGQPVGRELFKLPQSLIAPADRKEMLVSDLDLLLDSEPRELVVSGPNLMDNGGQLFFTASTSAKGRELYVINVDTPQVLTEPLEPIVDLNSSVQDSEIEHLTPMTVTTGNPERIYKVIFTGNDGGSVGRELYISDGTSLGTTLLRDITPGDTGSILNNFISLSPGLVVFTKEDPSDQTLTLWRTDGTEAGTFQIENFTGEPNSADSLTAKDFRAPVLIGSNLYFMLGNDELWVTNGQSDSGTFRVHRFRTSTESSEAQDFTPLGNGKIIFSAVTQENGREPWFSDLATGETELLDDMRNGTEGSDPGDFTPTGDGRVFFAATTIGSNRELFMTSGTGVVPMPQVNLAGSSSPENLFWHQGKLYFSAIDSGFNREVWILDSPPGGPHTLSNVEVNLTSNGSFPEHFTAFGNYIYFSAVTTEFGRELWRIPTGGGNHDRFTDLNSLAQSSTPDELVVMPATGTSSKLYFIATGTGIGRELWVTDGTSANTKVVKDIVPGVFGSMDDAEPAYLTVVGNMLYFVADDGVNGRELWKSNGTDAGTVMVSNINKVPLSSGTTDTFGSNPTELRNVNGTLFFLADDGVNGRELWKSNGTAAGTVMVSAPGRTGLVTGPGDADIQELTVINDVVCFSADDGVSGREVWISNGTSAGTYLLHEFVPGVGSSYPHNLASAGSQVVFSASDDLIGDEPRVALLASKLIVEQPVNTALEHNVSVVDFTPVTPVNFGGELSLTLRLKNTGITGIEKIVASIGGVHAADFSVFKKPGATLAKDTFTDLTVKFKPKEGGERTASLLISSTDVDHPLFMVWLSGDCSKDPTVGTQPLSMMVKVGQSATLNSTTSSGTGPISLQWRKNGGAIAGATSNPLYLWAVKLTDAGAYSAQFKNSLKPVGTGTSDNAQIGVVEDFSPPRILPLKFNTSTKLTVNAAGNGLSYLWKFSLSADLADPETLTTWTGYTTKTLTFPAAQTSHSGFYFCEVTGPGGTVVGGTTYVKVFNAQPEILSITEFPVGIVGVAYNHQVEVDPDPSKAPFTFAVKNLPAGLKLDAKTGVISGIPTAVSKPDAKNVEITASNGFPDAKAKSVVSAKLLVVALPTGLDGVFQGLVSRDEEINGSAGGRIEVTVTKTGSYSGKLIFGATTTPFKGNMTFGLDEMQDPPVPVPPYTTTTSILRKGIVAPLELTFTINDMTKSTLTGGISSVNVGGPVNATVSAWKATTNTARYLGLHNFGIRLAAGGGDTGNVAVPQGDGYGTFTVNPKGALTIAGMTADGEKITCATFVGPEGQVLLYQSLYGTARKGSICGLLTLDTGAQLDSPNDNVITSDPELNWTRPPATAVLGTAPNTRTYRAGFGLADTPVTTPVELEAFGGFYQPGTHLLQVVSGSPTTDAANLTFTGAGVDLASFEPDVTSLAIDKTTAKVLAPLPTAKTTISAVLKTGLFKGGFKLEDDDITTTTPAAKLNNPKELPRSVSYLGLIVPEAGNHRGVGYFMLSQIPPADGADPAKSAPILSGKVNFDND